MSDGALVTPRNRTIRVGTHLVTGRAKGTYVQIVQPDRITAVIGIDAEGYFNDNGDESVIITIAVLPSSISNDFLNFYQRALLPIPVVCREGNGRYVGATGRAMVVKSTDIAWSDGADVRSWVLTATKWRSVAGGMDPSAINEAEPPVV